MKRMISILLVSVIFVISIQPVFATDVISVGSNAKIPGVTMMPAEFTNTFSGKPCERKNALSREKLRLLSVSVSDVEIVNNSISLTVHLKDGENTTVLPIEGRLAASSLTANNINSTIIEVGKPVNGYTVKLFQIVNGKIDDLLLLNGIGIGEDLKNIPHIKLYLQDESNDLYLFEGKMPQCFARLNAALYDKAGKEHDYLQWARDLVVHNVSSIKTTEETSRLLGLEENSRALNSFSIRGYETTFTDEFYLGGHLVSCMSMPYIEFKHTNVSLSDSTWVVSFKIAEHTKYQDGAIIGYGNNAFAYRDLKVAFAAGDNTTFIRTYQEGRLYNDTTNKYYSNGGDLTVSFLKALVNALPNGSTFLSGLECIRAIVPYSTSVVLGNNAITLHSGKVKAVGESFPGLYLEECSNQGGAVNVGDYFTFHAVTQYEECFGDTETVGALLVEFNIEFSNQLTVATPFEFALEYTATE